MAKFVDRIKNYPPILCNAYKLGLITRRYSAVHTGIDSCTIAGLDVCTICDATVQKVYKTVTHGNCIEYGYDGVTVRYCHMANITVKVGAHLPKGAVVGQMGNTGTFARGIHLHLSLLLDGKLVDPEPYLKGQKKLPDPSAKNTFIGGNLMIRKITNSGLNLRSAAGVGNSIVYGSMPIGTILVCGATKKVRGATWAQVYALINGKQYCGWSNIGTAWSKEV